MWQKPAQPSASIYRAVQRVQQRPASARRSLSLSIRVPFVPASSLPRPPPCISLPFRPVALLSSFSSSSSSFSPLITVGVARQQPAHRGQANFLPAVILFRPSPLLSLCSARRHNPPPSGVQPFLFALLSSRRYLSPCRRFLPLFFFPDTRGGASSGSSRLSVTFFYRFSQRRIVITSPAIVP